MLEEKNAELAEMRGRLDSVQADLEGRLGATSAELRRLQLERAAAQVQKGHHRHTPQKTEKWQKKNNPDSLLEVSLMNGGEYRTNSLLCMPQARRGGAC